MRKKLVSFKKCIKREKKASLVELTQHINDCLLGSDPKEG
jgi:hypothetical protein